MKSAVLIDRDASTSVQGETPLRSLAELWGRL